MGDGAMEAVKGDPLVLVNDEFTPREGAAGHDFAAQVRRRVLPDPGFDPADGHGLHLKGHARRGQARMRLSNRTDGPMR